MIDIRTMFDPSEKPLDRLVTDGGFVGIFRKIGCIGDSLSSGEFEVLHADASRTYHDFYDYSWGQFLARMAGTNVENFSRGGMSCKWYLESWADENNCWERGKDCQVFLMALGCNDITAVEKGEQVLGNTEDVDLSDYRSNRPTVIGYYATILQRLHEMQPDSQFFLLTMPKHDTPRETRSAMNREIRKLAEIMPRTWLIDLEEYSPVIDSFYREKFYMDGHLNPAGYLFTAKIIASYMDYIIRHNMDCFEQVGLYGTDNSNINYKR